MQKSPVDSSKHSGGAPYCVAKAVGGLVLCHQSAIPMRRVARMARSKLTILPGSSKASWTADGEYLFRAEFYLHQEEIMPESTSRGMYNFAHFPPIIQTVRR
jgi:hypothetical protein